MCIIISKRMVYMEENNMKFDRNDIIELLSLSPRRFEHVLGTERCAIELAQRHYPDIDLQKVSFSALLHDMTKEYSVEEHIQSAKRFGIEFSNDELLSPKLLHSKTASYICRFDLKLDDDICDAVFYHTTGRPEMKPLEEILYFADYIEDTRKDVECITLRESYFKLLNETSSALALNKSLVLSFNRTIYNLMQKGHIIDKNTIEARNFYLLKTL